MTLLYSDPVFLSHETGDHPESADRLRMIPRRLEELSILARCHQVPSPEVDKRRLARVHSRSYIDEVWAFSKAGGGHLDADTVCSPTSFQVALQAAGAACDATERVLRGEDRQALCLVRPPGHHALMNRAMGFCIFNNIAVAALLAVEQFELSRVLIVDWDIHHGNGTQAMFWEDPRVGYLSVHRSPFYPGTGDEDETGEGPGLGSTLNLALAYGISREEYLTAFRSALEEFADQMRPELVLISAGFDTHRLDPVGNLGLEVEDFAPMTRAVLDVAATHAQGRVVSILEGGYHPVVLADSVATHLGEMLDWQDRDGGAASST
ncbi:MAG: histone deacetylase [Planctomycetota bacterium]